MAKTIIYWFRNDLRLHDNPALHYACQQADYLLPVYWLNTAHQQNTIWSFVRQGQHRQVFLSQALQDLSQQLSDIDSQLTVLASNTITALTKFIEDYQVDEIVCEEIAAPEEQAQVDYLRSLGVKVTCIWQSSLYAPTQLPFEIVQLPTVFSQFRQKIEKARCQVVAPIETPRVLPPLPPNSPQKTPFTALDNVSAQPDSRSAFPYFFSKCHGGERDALAFAQAYFASLLPQHYKQTRNGLIGLDYSSKLSPWLATGALSVRYVYQLLKLHEQQHGANDSTYWLWFELLWRDYFRFLHLRYGKQLYRKSGLGHASIAPFNAANFSQWQTGTTGHSWIDAGMRELLATGYLSNRMRQNVASYWLNELQGNWQAGAAWFESMLLDYDVYSNQGNWLYLAGIGTDPRGQRWFNPQKQAQQYDSQGDYQALWGQV